MWQTALAPNAPRTARVSLSIALAAATLWDYRLFDLRIFDAVAVASLIIFFLVTPKHFKVFLRARRDSWMLFSTIAAYSIIGFTLQGHRSSLAILALSAIGFILIERRDWLPDTRLFQWLLAAHILFFLLQFFAFYLDHKVIDFQSIIGAQSRMTERTYQIRAAGLFQEPNSYCLNIFILGTIVSLQRANWILVVAAACTMAMSESIWGAGAAFVLLLLYAISRFQSLRLLVTGLIALVLATTVVFTTYLWLTKQPQEALPYFYTRLLGIAKDPSTKERYLHNTCSSAEQAAIANTPRTVRALRLAFGEGLSTQYFRECLPANGIAFLFKSLGAVGLIFLLTGYLLALRRLPTRAKVYSFLAVGFSFTTYPLVTYVIFWIWLPAIIGLQARSKESPSNDAQAAQQIIG
jgi:hypothetical protein